MSKISDRLRASAALVEATKDWPKTSIERTMHDLMVEIAKQLTEGAYEIDRLRAALELIARDPGGVPGPRVFARDVLDGNIILQPTLET